MKMGGEEGEEGESGRLESKGWGGFRWCDADREKIETPQPRLRGDEKKIIEKVGCHSTELKRDINKAEVKGKSHMSYSFLFTSSSLTPRLVFYFFIQYVNVMWVF